jgi:hypothetical protein
MEVNMISRNLVCATIAAIVLGLTLLPSCSRGEYGWEKIGKPAPGGDISPLVAVFHRQQASADDRRKVLELIGTLEKIVEIEPMNYAALWQIGRYYSLMADAYSTDSAEKKDYYRKARMACERAVYSNPGFKKLIDAGETPFDACCALNAGQIEAMYYWYAATVADWKNGQNFLQKIVNFNTVKGCRKIMERMVKINPEWGGGHPYFAYALYYAGLPKYLGRDLKKSDDYFNRALKAGPNWLYIRYFRARYFQTAKNDKEAFKKDLEWVISRDPHKADSPYPWNVHFQRSARQMLAHTEDYF